MNKVIVRNIAVAVLAFLLVKKLAEWLGDNQREKMSTRPWPISAGEVEEHMKQ